MFTLKLSSSGFATTRILVAILDDCLSQGFGDSTKILFVENKESGPYSDGYRSRIKVGIEFFDSADCRMGEFEGIVRVYSNQAKSFVEAEVQFFALAKFSSHHPGKTDVFYKYDINKDLTLTHKETSYS